MEPVSTRGEIICNSPQQIHPAEYTLRSQRTPKSHSLSRSPSPSPSPLRRPIPKVSTSRSWWWWWEIGAAILSATSVLLIVLILSMVNNEPLESWRLRIQPNSLIAVLTTIGKSSMMVVITSCISQLKWHHFRRPQNLKHLQLMDNASRGPWGAVVMLFGLRLREMALWALGIISIIALGVEPTAQQILAFSPQEISLQNVSATIGIADSYASRTILANSQRYPSDGMNIALLCPQWKH
jgi:hypothetical protein